MHNTSTAPKALSRILDALEVSGSHEVGPALLPQPADLLGIVMTFDGCRACEKPLGAFEQRLASGVPVFPKKYAIIWVVVAAPGLFGGGGGRAGGCVLDH